ncbi:unnamed protein product [Lupinus luteus]|uniref:B box-type domain-containing protein n=1 Tax=Lupinus luteus TaxID=3873 RepID=A0AAV1YLI6_LUPLU
MVIENSSYDNNNNSVGGYGHSDGGEGDMNVKPAWLERLVGETFFDGCGVHFNQRKNEKNVFCLHCCLSICPHCFPSHPSHPLLQVDYMVYEGESLSSILHQFQESDFSISQFEGLRVDCSEVIDEDTQFAPTSSYSNTEATSNSVISCEPNNINKPRRFLHGIVLPLGSRRKGAPQRAPFS